MVDGGSNENDTQAYSKVLTLGSVHAKIQLGITICRFTELSNPTSSAPACIYGRNATMYGCNVEIQPSMVISIGRNTMIYGCNVLVIFKYNTQGYI